MFRMRGRDIVGVLVHRFNKIYGMFVFMIS